MALLDIGQSGRETAPMKKVTITYARAYSEYRVPGTDGREASAAYTDEEEDAVAIAKKVHGERISVRIRRVNTH